MKNYRITFTHNGKKYCFIRAISANLSGYAFEIAYRTEIRTYMTNNGLRGDYINESVEEV